MLVGVRMEEKAINVMLSDEKERESKSRARQKKLWRGRH
jgi:hypothetical protein